MKLAWTAATDQTEKFGVAEYGNGVTHIRENLENGVIRHITGKISFQVKDDEKIFMDGYQTWTHSPEYTKDSWMRGLNGIPYPIIKKYGLDGYGDYHIMPYPYRRGILHGFSYCYFRKGGFYRLFASLDESAGYTIFTYDHKKARLVIDRDAAGIRCSGEYPLFDLFYAEGSENDVFDAWFAAMGIRPRTTQKLAGYSSWYNRFQDISAVSIMQDLEGCKTILAPGDLFQIDDGWEPYIGDWLEADGGKFPAGMKTAADVIHEAGFLAGLWLAPFAAETDSRLFKEHPDWLVQYNGRPWKAGGNWSGFYALDIDKSEVEAYIREVFRKVFDEWGYDLVKLDFLYAAAAFGTEKETRGGRMIRAMKLLREVCGDHLILGCGVPLMPAFGLVDYCRISCDVSLDWDDKPYMRILHRERVSTSRAIDNIFCRRQLNGRAFMNDPDVFFLREENIDLADSIKHDLAQLDALLGGLWMTSDDPGSYSFETRKLYQAYRHYLTAGNVEVSSRDGIRVAFILDDYKQKSRFFTGLK